MDAVKNGLTYADAGVDIAAGNALVERIKPAAKRTNRAGVMSGLGGFGGLFDLKAAGYDDPILVAATDGVGTKLRLAIDLNNVTGVGIDLVAMCVNDLICQGAEPLLFLDYFATGKLDLDQAAAVIGGIAKGCSLANCALIGGETAEMPGLYAGDDFDLAGFAIGAMERGQMMPHDVAIGDQLIGLPSSGVHSNGFSLVRKILKISQADLNAPAPFDATRNLGDCLLAPTSIYVHEVIKARKSGALHGAAHITGGGLTENIPRVLPEGMGAQIDLDTWARSDLFHWLMATGRIATQEMLRTFNCGIGMVLVVAANQIDNILAELQAANPVVIGEVIAGESVVYRGKGL